MLERLTQKDRAFIKNQVASGYYASDIEVVRDAVRRLREKTQVEKLHYLRAMAHAGHEQLLRGEGDALTVSTMNGLLAQAKADHKHDKPARDKSKACYLFLTPEAINPAIKHIADWRRAAIRYRMGGGRIKLKGFGISSPKREGASPASRAR